MTTKNQDAEVWKGTNPIIEFEITGDDDEPLVVAGASGSWAVLPYPGGPALLTKDGADVTFPEDGKALVALDKTDLDDLAGRYWHELRVVDAQENETVPAIGQLLVYPSGTYTPP